MAVRTGMPVLPHPREVIGTPGGCPVATRFSSPETGPCQSAATLGALLSRGACTLDAVEIAKVMQSGDLIAVTIVAGLGAVPLIKGLHALVHGRHQRRREFLEIWKEGSLNRDDLWLEEAIRHLSGTSMSAKLIRHLAQLEWPSVKLRKLAMNSRFFEFDEERKRVAWRARWRERGALLQLEMAGCLVGYVVFSILGFGLTLTDGPQGLFDGASPVVVGVLSIAVAFSSFWHFISLVESRSAFLLVNGLTRAGLWASLRKKWVTRRAGNAGVCQRPFVEDGQNGLGAPLKTAGGVACADAAS